MRIVVSFGCNPVTAEDIVQEAYIKVDEMTKKGKDLSYKGDLNYWYMYKILRHLYLHLKIKEQKSKIVDQQYMKNDYGQTKSIEEVAQAPSYIDYNDFNEKFEKVLSELNWYDRSVFELVKLKIMIGLGDLIEKIIRIITLGYGKKIAKKIAKAFGYKDCGCDERQEKLNKYKINIKR